jgi:hypothetical protein
VQRATILVTRLDEPDIGAMVAGHQVGLSGEAGCGWAKRFNAGGLDVLEDEARSGRPPKHSPEVRSKLVSLAVQKPRSSGLPLELWTLALRIIGAPITAGKEDGSAVVAREADPVPAEARELVESDRALVEAAHELGAERPMLREHR